MAGEEHFVSGVAGRYATALFDLARDANTIDAVKADLERFDALVGESLDLARLVRSPVFSADEQLQLPGLGSRGRGHFHSHSEWSWPNERLGSMERLNYERHDATGQ